MYDFIPTMNDIDSKTKYWLVRTQGGEYYEEFFHDGYVGIGWEEFSDLVHISSTEEKLLTDQVRVIYPDESRPGHVSNQLRRFVVEMKSGDIVLIPSKTHVSFGRFNGDVYTVSVNEDDVIEGLCPFSKRRNVEWIRTVKRGELDPYLYKLLNSHHTITDATDEYSAYIDRMLHSFFIKGDKAHMVLRVQTHDRVIGRDLLKVIDSAIGLLDVYNEVNGTSLNPNEVELKVSVQSPGPIEFIADPIHIAVIGLILVFIVGGKLKLKITKDKEVDMDVETDGFIEKLLKVGEFLRKNPKRMEELSNSYSQSADKLDVEIPNELTALPEVESDTKTE